ncbi:MAG: hypothetical protein AAB340_00620 [Patescibacteria group bacterium]
MNTINVKLKKSEKERLNKIAMRYGLSLPELARRILNEVREEFELESLEDYENSTELKKDVEKAVRDYKKGKFLTNL